MKGRNTSCITIRLPDDIVKALANKAANLDFESPGQCIKALINAFLSISTISTPDHSDVTIDDAAARLGHIVVDDVTRKLDSVLTTEPLDADHYIEHDKRLSKAHSIITTHPAIPKSRQLGKAFPKRRT